MKQVITSAKAPQAIGSYSQAIKSGKTIYLSGQIPIDPDKMELIEGDFSDQVRQVFANLNEVTKAAGGSLDQIVKMTIYLIDMNDYSTVNEVMAECCPQPYPARAAVAVCALPKGVSIEIDAVMVLSE